MVVAVEEMVLVAVAGIEGGSEGELVEREFRRGREEDKKSGIKEENEKDDEKEEDEKDENAEKEKREENKNKYEE